MGIPCCILSYAALTKFSMGAKCLPAGTPAATPAKMKTTQPHELPSYTLPFSFLPPLLWL